MAQKLPKLAQKLAPAKKNSTDISAASATFCISDLEADFSLPRPLGHLSNDQHSADQPGQIAYHLSHISTARYVGGRCEVRPPFTSSAPPSHRWTDGQTGVGGNRLTGTDSSCS